MRDALTEVKGHHWGCIKSNTHSSTNTLEK